MEPHTIIKYPLSTEKSIRQMESENKLLFVVAQKATRKEVRLAIEKLFKVKVSNVNIFLNHDGEKRAYVAFSPETPALDVATKMGLM